MTTREVCLIDARASLGPFDFERDTLAQHGIQLRIYNASTSEAAVAAAHGVEVILSIALPVTASMLNGLPECRLVVRWAVGYDTIDVGAATELGVAVANCPNYCTEEVADHAAALILTLARKITLVDRAMHAGLWPRQEYRPLRRLPGQTLGFIGFGRIGRAAAHKLSGFDLRYLVYDPYLDPTSVRRCGAESVELDTLLADADIISVHVPLGSATHHLIGERELRGMQPTAYLVNTSRGAVIDEAALVRALSERWIAGAALDVFEEEPLAVDSPLRTMSNVILTPHMGAYSVDSLAALRREVCDTVIRWFAEGWVSNVVNSEVKPHLRRAHPSA